MFLRTAVVAEPGETRRRVGSALNDVESIATNLPNVTELSGLLERRSVDLVVVDAALLPESADAFIQSLRDTPDPPHLVVVGLEEDPERRAALLAAGCLAVIPDSVDEGIFHDCFRAIVERRLEEADAQVHEIPDDDFTLADYATVSPVMGRFLRSARRTATSDATVLVVGETGVGKGLLAQSLHNESPRGGPFVAVSCAALTPTLVESELFGHERGSFTGADRDRRGCFELAHRGTLFLDEIGELPIHLQPKLLRALEEREVQPLGSEEPIQVDVRFMTATNRDLQKEVAEGRFREDLYYRLAVMRLQLPALRERAEDIPEIAQSYVDHHRALAHSDVTGISEAAMECLVAYPWPGNIRELANVIERAVIMGTREEIQPSDLPSAVQECSSDREALTPLSTDWAQLPWRTVRRQVLDQTERRYLVEILRDSEGKIRNAAQRAGMAPRSLAEKMSRHGLRKEEFRAVRGR
jgi:DNA-binding NtrC family response regulator